MAHAEEAHRLCEIPLPLVSASPFLAALGGDRGSQLYPITDKTFPIGMAMNRNLTIKAGHCNHGQDIPKLVGMVRAGLIDPLKILTRRGPMVSALDAYLAFDERQPGLIKIDLEPEAW